MQQRWIERLIVHLRRFMLKQAEASRQKISAEDKLTLVISVARYCFRANYIPGVTERELQKVDALRARIETDPATASNAKSVAIFASYAPLYTLTNAEAIATNLSAVPDMADVIREQITEYFALQRRLATVEAITPVTDSVSEKVRAQYEDLPYPPWGELNAASFVPDDREKERLDRPGVTVLIAGCGTGQESSHLATAFPNANFLAIDITRTSLAYAMGKAEVYNLKNITYRQADILELGMLGRTFDYIHSFGVLHHLQDPEKGWATLVSLLKPDGMMFIGLYSSTARRSINTARTAIAKGGYPPTPEGMRRFRKDSPKLLSKKDLQTLMKAKDYYSLNGYRDALFNAHEDQFDIPRIKTDLKNMGLVFEGFRLPEQVMTQFRDKFPDDPKGLDLDHWHAFEQANPDIFIDCYRFWCSKS
jgi:2-polyprenyl-3-methyl-5-hydroxy-6-metoxy-1,4-benzoquinol methylase